MAFMPTWPSRVPTIASLMTPFLAMETNYVIPLWLFVMMLDKLVSWSPKSWSEYRWHNHLFSTLFQASTKKFSGMLHMAYFWFYLP
jgi:hypothetical protein